jgi:hypothetical protein
VLLEYSDGSVLGTHDRIEYGDRINGVPIVKKVTRWIRKYGAEPLMISEVLEVQPGPAPSDMFTTAAFGLVEITSPAAPTKKTPFLVWGLAVAAGILILAFFVRRRRRLASSG